MIQRDVECQFLVVEVNYERERIWADSIYAPHVAGQCMDLWRCLNKVLRHGRPRFLLGDFNMFYEVCQYNSIHSLMDAPK